VSESVKEAGGGVGEGSYRWWSSVGKRSVANLGRGQQHSWAGKGAAESWIGQWWVEKWSYVAATLGLDEEEDSSPTIPAR